MRPIVVLCLLVAGCATSSKAKLLEKTYADQERRHELFEANLRVLDANPQYVDEFFALARKHPATLERFVENQSRQLEHDPELADMTARHLREHPKALQATMEHTLDAVERDGAARRAIASAMRNRAAIATDIIVEEPDALTAVGKAMAKKAKDEPDARDHMKTAFANIVHPDGDEHGEDKKGGDSKKGGDHGGAAKDAKKDAGR